MGTDLPVYFNKISGELLVGWYRIFIIQCPTHFMKKRQLKVITYPVPAIILPMQQAKIIPLPGEPTKNKQEVSASTKALMPVQPTGYMPIKKHEHF